MKPEGLGRWDVLQRRVWVQGTLVAVGALHVGSGGEGADPVAADDPVVRDADGRPFIPGSSLKGAMRAFLERLADAHWLQEDDDGPRHEQGVPCWHRLRAGGEEDAWDCWVQQTARYDAERIRAALCPACRLLGAPHYAGRLQFRDLPLCAGGPAVQQRTGVGIDRDTGTAAPKILYQFEAVPAGAAFALEALVENPSDGEFRTLLRALWALARGDIPVGGKLSRGLGAVSLRGVRLCDLHARDGTLRRSLLSQDLEGLPWVELQTAVAAAGLVPEPPRVPAARLQAAFATDRELDWAEALQRLRAVFGLGGEGRVG